ncbi:MAG: glycosyltransferase [Acidobacteriota bacterium]|nr:glycosyltransferase [Acidobacteriota bacterium]
MKIVHIITGLGTGGANTMLLRLLEEGRRSGLGGRTEVISLTGRGALGDSVEALGIPLHALGAASPASMPLHLPALLRVLRRSRPDLIQGWMVHGNLAASLGALALPRPRPPVLWNIRQSLYDLCWEKRTTALLIRLAARLSRGPRAIIYNSRISAHQHQQRGYAPERSLLLPNGYDTERLKPDAEARAQVRNELGLEEETPLVGLVGRWDPVKDHHGFLQAMARVRQAHSTLHLLLVGAGIDPENDDLARWLAETGLTDRAHLLGERRDISRLTAALDVAVSSSYTEAFSNVVAEAMACGVPCAVTDVGDSALIVGDTGRIVAPRDPEALAAAVSRLLAFSQEERRELGRRARQRIEERYSLAAVTARYDQVYQRILAGESVDQVREALDASVDAPVDAPAGPSEPPAPNSMLPDSDDRSRAETPNNKP